MSSTASELGAVSTPPNAPTDRRAGTRTWCLCRHRLHGTDLRIGETRAVDGIGLEVDAGAVYGLLGPNGAGKTTAIRAITTLLPVRRRQRPTGPGAAPSPERGAPLHPPAPPGSPPSRYKKFYPKRKLALTPEERCAEDLLLAAEEVRYLDELELFAAIRADAQIASATIAKLAWDHFVREDLVREILRGREPRPPGLLRRYKPAPTLEPVKVLIAEMWKRGMAADRIWSELVDNHRAAISKSTLKLYLRALRHGAIWRL